METCSANPLSISVKEGGVHNQSACFFRVAKRLSLLLFYISSPSDVEIVFILRLTTAIIMGIRLNNRITALYKSIPLPRLFSHNLRLNYYLVFRFDFRLSSFVATAHSEG